MTPPDSQDPKQAPAPAAEPAAEKGISSWAVAWRQLKRDRVAMFAAASLAFLAVVALLSPLLANEKPLWASYNDRWFFPAFKDYLDENIPIPFGVPGALRRNSSFFSPAYVEGIPRPAGQTLPDWRAIKRQIDESGDGWYLSAPVPYYYKQTSSAIKQLPFAPVAHLVVEDGPADGKILEIVAKSVWSDEWPRLRSHDPSIDLSGVAMIHTAMKDGAEPVWALVRTEGQPPAQVTVSGQAMADAAVALKEGDLVVVGGRTFKLEVPAAHVFGTDNVGRDVLSRIIHGTVIAGSVGLVSVGIYVMIGIIIGALAGYFRGWVDIGISRLIEIVICFPTFFLIITIVALWETFSIYNIMIALGLISWTGVARLVRGEFLKSMSEDYVQAARALGLGHGRIIFRHILPNAIAPVFVSASFGVAGAILTESSLSFLGFGVAPPTASWGEILGQGRRYINENLYHLVWVPGFFIFYTVTMFNLLGEGLRDALDPRLRQ